jgi:hypothetical protein
VILALKTPTVLLIIPWCIITLSLSLKQLKPRNISRWLRDCIPFTQRDCASVPFWMWARGYLLTPNVWHKAWNLIVLINTVRFEVFLAVTMKNTIFWDVVLCRFCVSRRFVSLWRWRRYVPPKRRFTQDLHGSTSQKTKFFLINIHCNERLQ